MSPPPLQGKQSRRAVAFDITAEQYQMLIDEQTYRREKLGEHVSIIALARDAFEYGLQDEDGNRFGDHEPKPYTGPVVGGVPGDTGRLRDSLKVEV